MSDKVSPETLDILSFVFKSANDLIVILSDDFRYLWINAETHEKRLGYSSDELLGTSVFSLLHPDDKKYDLEKIKELYRGEGGWRTNVRLRHKNGRYMWFDVRGHMFQDSKGDEKLFFFAKDISRIREAERRLEESEERYRSIIEDIQEGYFEVDLRGSYTFVNAHHADYLGYPREELIGVSYKDALDESCHEAVFKVFNEVYRKDLPVGYFEAVAKAKRREGMVYEGSIHLKRDSSGQKTGFYGFVRDITERKAAQERLAESEQKYRLIWENANDLVSVHDHRLRYEYLNEKVYKKALGYSKEDLIGRKITDLVQSDRIEEIARIFARALQKKGETRAIEVPVLNKGKKIVWVDAKMKVFNDEKGALKMLVIARDVTERKEWTRILVEKELKYRTLFEEFPLGIVIADKEGKIVEGNRVALSSSVYDELDLIGADFRDLTRTIPKTFMPVVEEAFEEALEKGRSGPVEIKLRDPDGKLFSVSLQTAAIQMEREILVQIIMRERLHRKKKK